MEPPRQLIYLALHTLLGFNLLICDNVKGEYGQSLKTEGETVSDKIYSFFKITFLTDFGNCL